MAWLKLAAAIVPLVIDLAKGIYNAFKKEPVCKPKD